MKYVTCRSVVLDHKEAVCGEDAVCLLMEVAAAVGGGGCCHWLQPLRLASSLRDACLIPQRDFVPDGRTVN